MAMTGCALLSSPGNWMAWTLQAVTQAGTGVIAYMYITRQARRFQVRIDEYSPSSSWSCGNWGAISPHIKVWNS